MENMVGPSVDAARIAQLEKDIQAQGDMIRKMKKDGIVDKAKLEPHIERLKALKSELSMLTGVDPATVSKKSAPAGPKAADKPTSNPKKEAARQAKLAKFEAKQQKAAAAKEAEGKKEKKEKKKEKSAATVVDISVETVPGEKKDTSRPLPDAYHPKYVENGWYSWWEKKGFFKPECATLVDGVNPKGSFTMVIPPPNVTGSLHLGHALTNAIEDTLARWCRMRGQTVLWNPGTDHAGIATQVVVEKKLWRERGITRHDLGREAFVEEIWKWKGEYGNRIYDQLRSLGASVDWDRACFTMDPKMGRAVNAAFVQLHEKGMVYRSTRLVNWCTQLKSAISDLEVEHKALEGTTLLRVPGCGDEEYEFGTLVTFAYPVDGLEEEICVATTRVETMLADTAIAVHPNDPRYQHLHGRHVVHPFTDQRLPIITDTYVEREFATGAVKITPGHDFNDYEMGLRHSLPCVSMIDDSGLVNGICPAFQGMHRFEARKAVLQALKDKGLYRASTSHPMTLPICSRTKDIVEPMVKPQWFVDCTEPAAQAVAAVREGKVKLIPASHEKTWFTWLENIKPWCVSRQLWWGHRVPAYLVELTGSPPLDPNDEKSWVVAETEEKALEIAAQRFQVASESIKLQQDPDVLDTWFSSGLFPFSIFGWPENTSDLQKFFPGNLLETGHDILFFWVARMVMLSLSLTGQLPFTEVYLHALIRDAHGRKMSKSLGNVVDPVDVINGISLEGLHQKLLEGNLDANEIARAKKGQAEDYPKGIPECGTDALRFALLSYAMAGKDVNLDVNRIVGYRFFCNKLWNAAKFTLKHLDADFTPLQEEQKATAANSLLDRWILSRLSSTVRDANNFLQQYAFPSTTQALYSFWLYDLCDVYLEAVKPVLSGSDEEAKAAAKEALYTCFDTGLRLLHPIMPFITEELWQRLPRRTEGEQESIVLAAYPESDVHVNETLEAQHAVAYDIVRAIRSIKAKHLQPKDRPDAVVSCKTPETEAIATQYVGTITRLAQIGTCKVVLDSSAPTDGTWAAAEAGAHAEVFVALPKA